MWYNVWTCVCVCAHTCLCKPCLRRSEHNLGYLSPSSTLCEAGSLGCWLHMPGPLAWEGPVLSPAPAPPSSARVTDICYCTHLLSELWGFELTSSYLHDKYFAHWAILAPSSLRCAFLCCHVYFLHSPWESSPRVWHSGQSTWKEHLAPKKAKESMLSWLVSMTGQI